MNMSFIYAFGFALLAAFGNAIFVYGQKRVEVVNNPAYFYLFALTVCLLLFIITLIFWPKIQSSSYFIRNWAGIMAGGIGCYITYVGFYFLFTKFGASYYSLYAVVSILTTSILVGVFFFREPFNLYYGVSIVTALLTVLFFALGQQFNR